MPGTGRTFDPGRFIIEETYMTRQNKMTKDNDQSDNRKKDAERQKEGKRGGGRLRHLSEALYMELREHRSSFIVYFTLRIIVIVMLILQLLNRNYENVFLCALTLVLLIFLSGIRCFTRSTDSLRRLSAFPWWICSTGARRSCSTCRLCLWRSLHSAFL